MNLFHLNKNNLFSFSSSALVMIFFTAFPATHSSAKEIPVGASCRFKNIQAAINAANDGDIIKVRSGVYFENKIRIGKKISLIGENYPVIDAQKKNDGVIIAANDVKLTGFIIKNTATGSMTDFAGIRVFKANNAEVSNNILRNTFFGIVFQDAENSSVTNNQIIGENLNQTESGNGIQLWYCKNILIKNNYITKHRDGIYFEFSRFCHVENNVSEENFRYGLHFMFSDNDWYYRNIFRNNGTGAAVMYSKHISMLYNHFENNWGDASYALLLKDISDGMITGNHFTKNTIAVLLDGSNRIRVSRNLFQNNGWAVKLLANCVNDTFYKNNFIANTFDVSTNGTLYYSYFKNNYWDKYEGYDLNKDHLGDVPYRPVSLYSIIVEQIPLAIMLLRSFTVDVMDKAEKIIPSLIPSLLEDEQPVMQKNKI